MLGQSGTTTTTAPPNPAAGLVEGLTNLDESCGNDPTWVCRKVFEATDNQTLAGVAEWFVAKPLTILLIVVVALVASRLSRRAIKRGMHRMLDPKNQDRHRRLRQRTPGVLLRSNEEWSLRTEARVHTLTAVFQSLASVGVWFVALVWALGVLDIDFGPLVAGAGIAGVALGFGAQNVVRDFLAGFFLVVEDQFGVGDVVDLDPEVQGTVEKITLRATRVRSVDGTVWHVPNGQILRVGNQSQEWARALLDIEVAYDADLDVAQDVIAETAAALAQEPLWQYEILEAPEVWGIENLGPNGVTIRLVIKTRPASQWKVMRELRPRLTRALAEQGIRIPYPQLTIHRPGNPPQPGPATDGPPAGEPGDEPSGAPA